MSDLQIDDLKQFIQATVSQSETRVIGILCDRMDEGLQTFRNEMSSEFTIVRREMDEGFQVVRHEMTEEFTAVRREMADGFSGVGVAIDELSDLIDKDYRQTQKRVTKLERRAA